ncbi:MAG: acetyl-CoA carboxylase carboxyltransferase subunit beta [Alphaproteobacteria bacterium]|nr:acetyl-CoA carboxylase carboxyltransferase subunit beta [Alphaproteobacteria bacterium]
MNWLLDYVRPKLSVAKTDKDVPDNLWDKCPQCEAMVYGQELAKNLYVCPHCGYHLYLRPRKRLKMLFDNAEYTYLETPVVKEDPLQFKDTKDYRSKLKSAREKTKFDEAFVAAYGQMGGRGVVVGVMNFNFIGGSMGVGVGEGIVKAAEFAIEHNMPLILVTASGGARMQEGILSLMQMARTTLAIKLLKDKHLPYIVVLTNPTTGGVSASFAMLGDITIAEPDALIAFAGARVIKETIKADLPAGFQRAEYLKKHGMVDMIISRKELRDKLICLMNLLTNTFVKGE